MVSVLVNNLTLVVALCVVFRMMLGLQQRYPRGSALLVGVGFGLGTIVAMFNPWVFEPGIIFDGRSVLGAMAGVFGGPVAGGVTLLVGGAYRLALGGGGAWTGVGVLATSIALGLLWRRRAADYGPRWNVARYYVLGLAVHATMLAWMFTLQTGSPWRIVALIAPPVLGIYPIATVIAALLFEDQLTRFRTAEALRVTAENTGAVFQAAPFPIAVSRRADGTILQANQAFVELFFGDGPVRGHSIVPIYADPAAREEMVAGLSRAPVFSLETQVVTRARGPIPVMLTFTTMRFEGEPAIFGALMDLSERRELERARLALEAKQRQQQRLESIGTLAAGVAHEINNPVNGVMNYTQLLLDGVESEAARRGYLEDILSETERIATIVRSLLAFARQDDACWEAASVTAIVESTLGLVGASLRRDAIDVQSALPDDLPDVVCRPQQIRQVLMNLVTNARDALNARYVGGDPDKRLRILAGPGALAAPSIRLTVEDHGVGIPAAIVGRVFDPFFTTKSRHYGTGLGLSVSHGIVADHGGTISIEARPGGGTLVHVDLPNEGPGAGEAVRAA